MDDEHGIYNSDACAVCYKFISEMKMCEKCLMVSYCGDEHQADHWRKHEEVCKAVQEVRRNWGVQPGNPVEITSCDRWWESQREFTMEVTQKLQRDLTRREREMSICAVKCKARDYDQLYRFIDCEYCDLEQGHFCINHDSYIQEYTEATNTIVRSYCMCELRRGYFDDYKVDSIKDINNRTACRGMWSFAESYLIKNSNRSRKNIVDHCKCFTQPLTILFILEQIQNWMKKPKIYDKPIRIGPNKYKEERILFHEINTMYNSRDPMSEDNEPEILDVTSLVIHVICTDDTVITSLRTWEVLFHFIKSLKDLTIIMVGPGLTETGYSAIEPPKCDMCRDKNLLFEYHDASYDYYVNISPLYRKPDLIVAFNAKFYDYTCGCMPHDLWDLHAMAGRKCPLVLTASTERRAVQNMETMFYELENRLPDITKINPFTGFGLLYNDEKFTCSNFVVSIYNVFPKKD